MNQSQPSRTAESMAMFRALESARSPETRRFADPFAVHFLRASMRFAVHVAQKFPVVQTQLTKFIDRRWPGARPSGVARTALIDRALRSALASGIDQVVILGAGYDCRAYRVEEIEGASVFEVDQGDTQRIKRERLSRILRPLPSHVTFVEMDFLKQALAEVLLSSGFDSSHKTFFIWEGVTHYLDADAVNSTLRFVGRCATGSLIAFTYIHRGLLDGSQTFTVSPNVVRLLEKAGEPWKFGFYPVELRLYLRERRLDLIEDLGATEYGALFLGATEEEMKGYDFYRAVVATIGSAGAGNCQK